MRMELKAATAAAVLLLLITAAGARPVAVETLSGLAEKSDLLVVCEVMKIESLATEKSERWNAQVTTRRATLRVVRGIQTADGTAVNMEEITLDYPALSPGNADIVNGPAFPVLAEGEVALFPLKRVEGAWRFVSEEDMAMVMPAARRAIAAQPVTVRDYLLAELAGALVNGDYRTMARAGKYLAELGTEVPLPPQATGKPARPTVPVADAVYALIRAEIGESGLRVDPRWLQMGLAAYMSTGMTPPAIADLLADDAPVRAPFQLARLCFRRAGERDLDQRIIRLLVAHQEDPGAALNTAAMILVNYARNPDLIAQERSAIEDGKPAAMAIADILVKDAGSPLAAKAAMAARMVLDEKAKPFPQEVDAETARHAVALLLRVGSDDDFTFFLDQIARAKAAATPQYQQYLLAAGGEENLGVSRCLAIARLYIDDETTLTPPVEPRTWRICDVAAGLVGRVAGDDFGVKPESIQEIRDAGVVRARKYLKSKE